MELMDSIPLITIVTVSYNAEATIEKTILSVIQQTYSNIEYIIIDGNSFDKTISIIKKYENYISYWISEPDKGVYDAMNKGIKIAHGDWICFMNSGDTFHSSNVLNNIFTSTYYDQKIGVIYGDAHLYRNNQYIMPFSNQPFWKSYMPYRTGKGICHQSMFTRTVLAKQIQFNLEYRISADFDMAYKIYKLKYQFLYVPVVVCNFDTDGMSSTGKHWKITFKETGKILKCRYNPGYWALFLYKLLKTYIKHN